MIVKNHDRLAMLLWMCVLCTCSVLMVNGAEPVPPELREVEITEHLGETLPLDATFVNERGEQIELAQYFNQDRPVVLMLVYYTCPTLCNFVLNGFTEGLKELSYTPGDEFEVVTISIDPTETPELAEAKKKSYLDDYGRAEAAGGWHWLTGNKANIDRIADATGFEYRYDMRQEQYAHLAAIFVLTPEGTLSRYLYGIQFPAKNLKLALLEAGEGKIGSTLEQLVLFCYHYDPISRKYGILAWRVMQLGGLATMLLVGGLIGFYLLWERRQRRSLAPGEKTESASEDSVRGHEAPHPHPSGG